MRIPPAGLYGHGTETAESWLHQLLHPDHIPPEALLGGLTVEQAWGNWCRARSAEAKGLPSPDHRLSIAEAWWWSRFDRAHQQEHGADLRRGQALADRQAELEAAS